MKLVKARCTISNKKVALQVDDDGGKVLGIMRISDQDYGTMESQVYVDTNSAKCDNEEIYIIIDHLNSAITQSKKVKFVYKRRSIDVQNKKKHTEKTFTVSPYALIWKDDHYYLVCNNEKYDNLMIFFQD